MTGESRSETTVNSASSLPDKQLFKLKINGEDKQIELGKRAVVRALRQAFEMKHNNDSQFHRTGTETGLTLDFRFRLLD